MSKKVSLTTRVLATLKGGDESKINKFESKLLKYFAKQKEIRQNKIESLNDKCEDANDRLQEAIVTVDLEKIKIEGGVSYIPSYVSKIQTIIDEIDSYQMEIQDNLDEIEKINLLEDSIYGVEDVK